MTASQNTHYDIIVLGSGPGGQRAAVQAAKLGKRALVIEKQRLGGACLHLGTIPSKALREAALSHVANGADLLRPVMARTKRVIEDECEVIATQLTRNKVEYVAGVGSFIDKNTVKIDTVNEQRQATGDKIVIATGTRPRRPADLAFDEEIIFDSDTILDLDTQPRSLLVLGAGVIGCEYASIFAKMGVKVTLMESRAAILASIDPEIVAALIKQFEMTGITLLTSTNYTKIEHVTTQEGRPVASVTMQAEGQAAKTEQFDAVLYCLGRTGNYENLNLQSIGLQVNDRGSLVVNRNYQTQLPHIYAVGDIIGAPALAASSSEQGRLAALHAFTGAPAEFPDTFPYGIYTIPEISSVGYQESQLAKRGIKYVIGKAKYSELARGKMINDETGFLKIIVHAKTHRIVGVHVIGTSATELVHIGQVAMSFGASVEFFVDNVFNYPTLAEAYKVAAYNALNQLKALKF